jgi:hypothetical protein
MTGGSYNFIIAFNKDTQLYGLNKKNAGGRKNDNDNAASTST